MFKPSRYHHHQVHRSYDHGKDKRQYIIPLSKKIPVSKMIALVENQSTNKAVKARKQ